MCIRDRSGDRVHKGQVLARLNPITAQTQVDSATASLDELKATAAVAEAEWARTQRARDSFSVEEAERRRTSAVTAEAKVKAAEAQLADAQNRMAHTTVLAPEDGIVLTRTAEVGQIAVPGTTILFRLARNGEIELRGQVAEQEIDVYKRQLWAWQKPIIRSIRTLPTLRAEAVTPWSSDEPTSP